MTDKLYGNDRNKELFHSGGYATGGLVDSPTVVVKEGDLHQHFRLDQPHRPIGPPADWLEKELIKLDPQALFAKEVKEVADDIVALLIEKNRKYGDSALNPSRIFARSDAVEQIRVRIDDKLTRLKNAQNDEDEDVVKDLLGYLIILRVAQKRAK